MYNKRKFANSGNLHPTIKGLELTLDLNLCLFAKDKSTVKAENPCYEGFKQLVFLPVLRII
jgi:hypothetical protein